MNLNGFYLCELSLSFFSDVFLYERTIRYLGFSRTIFRRRFNKLGMSEYAEQYFGLQN